MLSRTTDASGETAPRELIHLLTSLQQVQLGKLDLGRDELSSEQLFDRACFKEAMVDVSRVRVEQTLYAEYPTSNHGSKTSKGRKPSKALKALRSSGM